MRREQVFWGWGEPGAGPSLPEHAGGFLRDELGVSGDVVDRPVALDDVRLREPALDPACSDVSRRSPATSATDREARVLRCRGKSYLDLLAQRAGDCEDAPDAVVAPAGPRPGARRAAGVQRGGRGGRAVRRRDERGRRPRAAARAVRAR